MIAYDPRGMNWDQYNALMIEQFAANPLPKVPEAHWKIFVNEMTKLSYFTKSAIPTSDSYQNWQDWAKAMVGILSITKLKH